MLLENEDRVHKYYTGVRKSESGKKKSRETEIDRKKIDRESRKVDHVCKPAQKHCRSTVVPMLKTSKKAMAMKSASSATSSEGRISDETTES